MNRRKTKVAREHTKQSDAVSKNSSKRSAGAKILVMACLLGAAMGVVFIVIQPLFGMDTLTSRHAASYQQLGHWNSIAAITIAWTVHMGVSVFYGLLSGIVSFNTARLELIALFTLVFAWLTTIIAPPANAIVVQLVSFRSIQLSQLPSLNFSLDAKFLLHLVFFSAISTALYVYTRRFSKNSDKNSVQCFCKQK